MMEKVVAIFVACMVDLLSCGDLPFIDEQLVFSDPDSCNAAIVEITRIETEYRKSIDHTHPVVMGKCVWWLDEQDIE